MTTDRQSRTTSAGASHDHSTRGSMAAGHEVLHQEDIVRSSLVQWLLVGLRFVLGFFFLWPFLDKMFGLGYATPSGKGWIDGGQPAQGFMTHAQGPFASFFNSISGPWADWAFMIGLLCIGVAVILGAGLKVAAWSGTVLLFLMYLAQFPIGQADAGYNNPLIDDHWLEALGLLLVAYTFSGDKIGLGRWWGARVGNGMLR